MSQAVAVFKLSGQDRGHGAPAYSAAAPITAKPTSTVAKAPAAPRAAPAKPKTPPPPPAPAAAAPAAATTANDDDWATF